MLSDKVEDICVVTYLVRTISPDESMSIMCYSLLQIRFILQLRTREIIWHVVNVVALFLVIAKDCAANHALIPANTLCFALISVPRVERRCGAIR
jgi:hypothetical protein